MTSGCALTTLVTFIISTFFVIHPVTIPTPRPLPRIPINLTTAPILAIALLWTVQCLDSMVIRNGIVGTEGIKPYNILVLFFSLAYMAITLDITGVLEVAVSNMELGSWAWVMAESAASMVLFVGNPTDVVICEGFGVDDAAFTAYTILPFLACNIFYLAVYRDKVPRTLARAARRNPREALLDPVSAWVGSIMLGAALVLCLVAIFLGIDAWMISLPFAVGKLLFDLGWDHHQHTYPNPIMDRGSIGKADCCAPIAVHQRAEDTSAYCSSPDEDRSRHSLIGEATPLDRHPLNTSMSPKMGNEEFDEGSPAEERQHTQNSPLLHSSLADMKRPPSLPPDEGTTIESQPGTSNLESETWPQPSTPKATIRFRAHMDYRCDQLVAHFPTFFAALPRLPFALIPFTFSQFILIEALNHQGWVQVFANWLVRATGNQIHPTISLIGVLGVILCNFSGTNIGVILLLTKVVRAASLPYVGNCPAAIALAAAPSPGAASPAFSASLARTILAQNDTHVRQMDSAFWNPLPILVMAGVGLTEGRFGRNGSSVQS